jgi:hypothetical protein
MTPGVAGTRESWARRRGMEKTTRVGAIRRYFGEGSRPVSMDELKALSHDEREELGRGAAKELGMELEDVTAK